MCFTFTSGDFSVGLIHVHSRIQNAFLLAFKPSIVHIIVKFCNPLPIDGQCYRPLPYCTVIILYGRHVVPTILGKQLVGVVSCLIPNLHDYSGPPNLSDEIQEEEEEIMKYVIVAHFYMMFVYTES